MQERLIRVKMREMVRAPMIKMMRRTQIFNLKHLKAGEIGEETRRRNLLKLILMQSRKEIERKERERCRRPQRQLKSRRLQIRQREVVRFLGDSYNYRSWFLTTFREN
jgi:hypothetical protein